MDTPLFMNFGRQYGPKVTFTISFEVLYTIYIIQKLCILMYRMKASDFHLPIF
jgi:hypothetical protein